MPSKILISLNKALSNKPKTALCGAARKTQIFQTGGFDVLKKFGLLENFLNATVNAQEKTFTTVVYFFQKTFNEEHHIKYLAFLCKKLPHFSLQGITKVFEIGLSKKF